MPQAWPRTPAGERLQREAWSVAGRAGAARARAAERRESSGMRPRALVNLPNHDELADLMTERRIHGEEIDPGLHLLAGARDAVPRRFAVPARPIVHDRAEGVSRA